MAKLSTLVVDLQLQSAQLRQGLDEANRKLEEFAKQSERTANFLEGMFAWEELKAGLTTFKDWLLAGAAAVGTMQNLAKAAGTPVEEFSKLAYAAERFGFESDNLSESFGQLSEYMAEAKKGSAEHVALFKGMGISVSDAAGNLRSTGDVFRDLAQRFSETRDGAAKTALAVKFFGEEGIKLIPMLNQGKAGLASLGEEASRTGNVITEQGAASAVQFNAALSRLQKAGEGLAASVAQDLAPSMAAFADHLTTSKNSSEAFNTASVALAGTIRTLSSAFVLMAGGIELVGTGLGGLWSAQISAMQGDFTAAKESLAATLEAMRETGREENARINAIWAKQGPGATMAADAQKAKPAADVYLSAIEAQKKAAEGAAAAQKKAADRAADAQKRLAEAARKAAEESGRALEESVKAALALERQHAAIDRAAAKRLEDGAATDGFAGMEDAAERMVAAQKAAATMRGRAAERERGGDILGADSATRKADELAELADRASAAVDAFREMAKTAEEKSAETMEAQIAAVASLELAFDGIEQEVAARRAAFSNPDVDPTAGFSGFHVALDALAATLKEEARLRSEAALLERAGRLGEARQLMLAADAQRALAETASAAADALSEMERSRAAVPSELGGMLASGMGSATSAMVQGVETGAAAGPVGAVVGGLVGLLSQSEQFQEAMGGLEEIFQALANSVGKLIEPLMPLLTIVAEVASGLGALFEVLSPLIEFVVRPLFEVFKGFGLAVLGLVKFIGEIINGIVEFFGGEALDLSGIDKSIERLRWSAYGAAKEQDKVAEAARESAGALNGVSWWRESLARFGAVENGRTGGSSGNAPVIHDNSQTNIEVNGVTDPEEVAERVHERVVIRNNRRAGSRTGELEMP